MDFTAPVVFLGYIVEFYNPQLTANNPHEPDRGWPRAKRAIKRVCSTISLVFFSLRSSVHKNAGLYMKKLVTRLLYWSSILALLGGFTMTDRLTLTWVLAMALLIMISTTTVWVQPSEALPAPASLMATAPAATERAKRGTVFKQVGKACEWIGDHITGGRWACDDLVWRWTYRHLINCQDCTCKCKQDGFSGGRCSPGAKGVSSWCPRDRPVGAFEMKNGTLDFGRCFHLFCKYFQILRLRTSRISYFYSEKTQKYCAFFVVRSLQAKKSPALSFTYEQTRKKKIIAHKIYC